MHGHVLLVLFCPQAAQSVNKALEQFVKPEQLDGENSYKCSKYDGGAGGQGSGEAWGERVWRVCLTSKVPGSFQDRRGRPWLCSPRARAPSVNTP